MQLFRAAPGPHISQRRSTVIEWEVQGSSKVKQTWEHEQCSQPLTIDSSHYSLTRTLVHSRRRSHRRAARTPARLPTDTSSSLFKETQITLYTHLASIYDVRGWVVEPGQPTYSVRQSPGRQPSRRHRQCPPQVKQGPVRLLVTWDSARKTPPAGERWRSTRPSASLTYNS